MGAFLVLVGTANIVIATTSRGGGTAEKLAGNVNMFKMLRLARLARTVRVLIQFRTLWMLVQGLLHAVLPMLWTCLIMIVVVYTFAIIGMELIVKTKSVPEYMEAATRFDSVWVAM